MFIRISGWDFVENWEYSRNTTEAEIEEFYWITVEFDYNSDINENILRIIE